MTHTDTPDRDPQWSPSAINDSARAMMTARAQQHDRDAVRYSAQLTLSVQPGFRQLIDDAARRAGVKPTEWSRQALTDALKAAGIDPAQIAPRDAGTLYDSRDGKRCYALVAGTRALAGAEADPPRILCGVNYCDKPDLADASYHPAGYVPRDGDRWLPIEHVDSAPFDAALHWRLPHIERIEADRVVREFPVIPKSLEAM